MRNAEGMRIEVVGRPTKFRAPIQQVVDQWVDADVLDIAIGREVKLCVEEGGGPEAHLPADRVEMLLRTDVSPDGVIASVEIFVEQIGLAD